MGYYSVGGNQATIASTYKGLAAIWTQTTATVVAVRRTKWFEIIIGATTAPNATDCAIQVDVSRLASTTSIAGTSFTPNPLDPADGAAIAASITNSTTEAAAALISTQLLNFGINQRATTRWVASQESQYLTAPATNLNGLYLRGLSATYAAALSGQVTYME